MKIKILIVTCLIIVISLFGLIIINNKSIYVTKQMYFENGEIESAWDFKKNLKIGWNLGMSFSANINYPDIIKYKIIVNNEKDMKTSDLFECDINNKFNADMNFVKTIVLEFDIPYTYLDGVLYWEIENLSFNNKIVYYIKEYQSVVKDGKLEVSINTNNVIDIKDINIQIKINKFYEDNTHEKVNFYETFWCNIKTTKQLFKTLKNEGFNAIRISFDVYNHIDENDVIDDKWLSRLKEVVDWCIQLDMYCLVDIVETYGLYVDNLNEDKVNLFIYLWEQLATFFQDYGGKLLFSPFNEIRNSKGNWDTNNVEELANMNHLYQIFVDTIRSTGGYNKERNLLLTTYAASFSNSILEKFMIPNDSVNNHLLVECHNYQPVRFTFNEINLGSTDFLTEWGNFKDKKEMKKIFQSLNKFIKKTRLPLIIGEFGVVDRIASSERIEYLNHYIRNARKYKIGLFIFDDAHDFAIIDRKTCQFIDDKLVDAILSEV